MGDIGCGSIAKICNNLIAFGCNTINTEAFVLGVKAGIKPERLWECIIAGTGSNELLKTWPRSVFKGNFDPGFKLKLALKDCRLAIDLSKEYDIPMPLSAAVEQRLLDAFCAGLGEKSLQSPIVRLEELTNVKVRTDD